jgi:hypothetical protein
MNLRSNGNQAVAAANRAAATPEPSDATANASGAARTFALQMLQERPLCQER